MFALSAVEREALGTSLRGSSNMGSPNNVNGLYADRRSPPISSTSSPPPMFSNDAFSVSSMGSSMGGGEREGAVSRCLHVGNVPANMTEAQLMRELERYGEVDGLKLGKCVRFLYSLPPFELYFDTSSFPWSNSVPTEPSVCVREFPHDRAGDIRQATHVPGASVEVGDFLRAQGVAGALHQRLTRIALARRAASVRSLGLQHHAAHIRDVAAAAGAVRERTLSCGHWDG
jgi:hypothetical protein